MARPLKRLDTPSLHVLLLTTELGGGKCTSSVVYIALTRAEIIERVASSTVAGEQETTDLGDNIWSWGPNAYLRATETGLLSPRLAKALDTKKEAPL